MTTSRLALTINALSAAMLGMAGLAGAAPMHCAKAQGGVRHDAQGDYLYLSDVLGEALPPP